MGKGKLVGYFLFMQEKRETVDGWAYKSNHELQFLCDPLWRALSKEEKMGYKEMKKLKKDIMKSEANMEKQKSLCSDEATNSRFPVKGGMRVAVLVGHVGRPDLVWVTPVLQAEEMQTKLDSLQVSKTCPQVDLNTAVSADVFAARFTGDGRFYRCKVVKKSEEEDKLVTVRFIDYGNEERVGELFELPVSLKCLTPLAVQVVVGGMTEVTDSAKNRARVERRLGVDDLRVTVTRKGVATFYCDNKEIVFVKKDGSGEAASGNYNSNGTYSEEFNKLTTSKNNAGENITTDVRKESVKRCRKVSSIKRMDPLPEILENDCEEHF